MFYVHEADTLHKTGANTSVFRKSTSPHRTFLSNDVWDPHVLPAFSTLSINNEGHPYYRDASSLSAVQRRHRYFIFRMVADMGPSLQCWVICTHSWSMTKRRVCRCLVTDAMLLFIYSLLGLFCISLQRRGFVFTHKGRD